MNVAKRDIKTFRLIETIAAHKAAIINGCSNMKERSENNKYLQDVIADHSHGLQATIDGYHQQKIALLKILDHINLLCDEDGCRKSATKQERARIIKEMKKIDKEIASLETRFK
tara:strand:- start:66 stop:407 length:342 start_codon:yes stop_codon:yes gene_type:complete